MVGPDAGASGTGARTSRRRTRGSSPPSCSATPSGATLWEKSSTSGPGSRAARCGDMDQRGGGLYAFPLSVKVPRSTAISSRVQLTAGPSRAAPPHAHLLLSVMRPTGWPPHARVRSEAPERRSQGGRHGSSALCNGRMVGPRVHAQIPLGAGDARTQGSLALLWLPTHDAALLVVTALPPASILTI